MPAVESLLRLVTAQIPAPRYEKDEISGLGQSIVEFPGREDNSQASFFEKRFHEPR
jgi:hypothetical protein